MAVFGASTDKIQKNKQFAKKLELKYPLLSDTDQKVAKAYGILKGNRAKRTAIVVSKDGKIAHILKKVNAKQHGIQLVQLLEKLKIEKKAAVSSPPTMGESKLKSEGSQTSE